MVDVSKQMLLTGCEGVCKWMFADMN
jgi:hypothetical protein